MSWLPCDAPRTDDAVRCASVQTTIVPRARDLGGFEVRRVLPSVQRRMVGPFIRSSIPLPALRATFPLRGTV